MKGDVMRVIINKYQSACKRCNNTLEIGTEIYYEKSQGVFCIGCEPKTEDEIRYYRTLKAQKRADQLINKSNRLRIEANDKLKSEEHFRGDYAFNTQPGHIPERARLIRRWDKGRELLEESEKAKEKAESIMIYKTKVKGDAERKRELQRTEQDKIIKVGSIIYDFCFGKGIVVSIHKKSYRIKFDSGGTYSRDKTYVKLIN